MDTVTVYELRYSQNGGNASDGPSIATVWDRAKAAAYAARAGDIVVVDVDLPESVALAIAE